MAGRPDRSTTSLRRSARPAPHARRVTKVAPRGCCAVWRGARVWVKRPGARGSRTRPVITAQALALLLSHHCDAKYQWTNAPTHPPSHRGRTDKWRAASRLPEPLDRRGSRMVGRCSGGRSRDGLPTAQRAEAGGEGRHEGDLRTEVKNTERRRAARSFCAQPLTEEPQVSPLPAEGLMVWGYERHQLDVREYAARRAPRGVVRACMATGQEPSGRLGLVVRASCVGCGLALGGGAGMCVCWAVSTCMCDDYPSGRDLCAADSAVIKRHQGINKTSHPRVAPPSLHCVTFVFLPQNRDGCRSMQAGC